MSVDVDYAYKPCDDCRLGKHYIARTDSAITVIVQDEQGEQGVLTIPGGTTYMCVGALHYIPTLACGDEIPDGHDKTLIELWEQHGLMPLEWSVPAG